MATLFTVTAPSHHRFLSPSQHQKQNLPLQPVSVALAEHPESAAITLEQQMTDLMASPVTRRFGIGAGFAWAGFQFFGVVSEQMKKSRVEVLQEDNNIRDLGKQEEIVSLPNGIRYCDLQIGSGATPSSGYLVVFDVKGQVHGTKQVFVDTFGSKDNKSLSMVINSRPYSKGLCEGIEYVLKSMKAGGKRRVIIPPSLGFGDKKLNFGPGLQIPPSATLEYIIEVDTVYCFQTIV